MLTCLVANGTKDVDSDHDDDVEDEEEVPSKRLVDKCQTRCSGCADQVDRNQDDRVDLVIMQVAKDLTR